MNTATFVWLIALPLLATPLVYLAGRLIHVTPALAPVGAEDRSLAISPLSSTRRRATPEVKPSPAYWTALIALAVTWIVFAVAARDLTTAGVGQYAFGAVTMRLDGISLLLSGLALTLGTFVVIFSGPYMAGETGEEKYYAMLLSMIGAMIGLACAADLFNLWIWFETMAVSSYLLVAFYRDQLPSLEAGVKYLVQSATGSVLVLLGIALVLAQTGTLGIDQIRTVATASPVLLAAGALFTIGFGVKIALVPLHTWLPDAHSQAPSGISAMLSGVVIEAGLIALLRALGALSVVSWGTLLMGFGALNMLVGNLLALRQTQVKRLLAYSSLSQVGYMLLGIGIGIYTGQTGGAEGGLFHLLTHGLMKGLAFLSAGALLYALYTAAGSHNPLMISDLAGAAKRYPLAALALSVAVLGLGGLPPLAGFMSKWQILAAGVAAHDPLLNGLVVFAAINSVLSLAYYAPLVNVLYRQETSSAVRNGAPLPTVMCTPLVVLALAIVVIGVWPGLVHWLTGPAGSALMAAFGR